MAATSCSAASLATPLLANEIATRTASSSRVASPARKSLLPVCSADSREARVVDKVGQVASALALAAVVATGLPEPANADVAGLTPCSASKAFDKREKTSIKKLTSRLKLYSEGSAPALALNATIEKTKKRFDTYRKEGLLCGSDGLPHLIVDGDQAHLGEFVYPGIVFLYIAGWIGWVGREYLVKIRSEAKPTQKEIIIDVPLALSIMFKGFTWPLAAFNSLKNGDLLESDSNITVSPR